MTAHLPFCKTARRVRRSSTGHGRMRPDIPALSPIAPHSIAFYAAHRSFAGRGTAQLAASVRTQSTNSLAEAKSP